MDGEVGVTQFAPPVGLGIAVPFFGQGEAEHVTVEVRCPLGLAGDEDDSGDEPHIFRAL
jgi:hypothetical protein